MIDKRPAVGSHAKDASDAQAGCPEPEALGTYFPRLLSFDKVAREYLVKGPLSTKALFKKRNGEEGQGAALPSPPSPGAPVPEAEDRPPAAPPP